MKVSMRDALLAYVVRSSVKIGLKTGLMTGVLASGVLYAQEAMKTTKLAADAVKTVGTGVTAPEGPSVLPDGRVAMVEFSPGNIVTISADGKREVLVHPGSGVAGTVVGKDGALYVAKLDTSAFMRRLSAAGGDGMAGAPSAENEGIGAGAPPPAAGPATGPAGGMGDGMSSGMQMDGTPSAILRVDLKTKEVKTLYSQLNGKPLGSPNDLVVDEWGDLWITEQTAPGVLNARTDGSQLKLAIEGIKGINGIALSPDKRTLYVMNDRKLVSYQITGRGTLKSEQGKPVEKVVAVWPEKLHEPDGLKTEANGNILLAAWEDGIVRISPAGKFLSQTVVPEQQVINMAFSPKQKKSLYLAAHPATSMSGSLLQLNWGADGAP